jgi:hypothetical protein
MAILKDDRKNYLINGAFDIWQRGTSTSSNTVYIADRWRIDSSLTQTTSRISDTALGTPYAARVEKSGGSGFYQLLQPLETFTVRDFAGSKVNFSVYLKANATLQGGGTVRLVQRWGTGIDELFPSGGADVFLDIDATTLSTSDYIRYDFTFDVPTNATSYSVAVRVNDDVANGSQLDMKNIMLVQGDKPTSDFERAGRSVGEELSLCQRYFEKSYNTTTPPGTIIGTGCWRFRVPFAGDNYAPGPRFAVEKRVNATTVAYNISTGASGNWSGLTPNFNTGTTGFSLLFSSAPNLTIIQGHWTADAEIN